MKFIKLFLSSKILQTHQYRFIKTNKCMRFPTTNFVGKLEKHDNATLLFIAKKQQKAILNFSLDSLIATE